ncbi:hypothetical protein SLA2020_047800 [Shorea laevis]
MTGGVTNSINAKPKSEEGKKEIDDLKKQVEELQEKVSELVGVLAKKDEINSKDVFKQDLAAGAPDWNSKKWPESTDAGTKFSPSLWDSMDAGTEFHWPPPLDQSDSIGQRHTNIDYSFCRSFDPPKVVPDPFVSDEFTNMGGELIGCGLPSAAGGKCFCSSCTKPPSF